MHPERKLRLLLRALWSSPVLLLSFFPGTTHAQGSDFGSVIDKLSATLDAASQSALARPRIFVNEFQEAHHDQTMLAPELTKEFSQELSRKRTFDVVDGPRPFEFKKSGLLEEPSPASTHSATHILDGYLDELEDQVVLRITLARRPDKTVVFDQRIALPLTPDMKALAAQPPIVIWVPNSRTRSRGIALVFSPRRTS